MPVPSNAAAPSTRFSGRLTSCSQAVWSGLSLSTWFEPPAWIQPARKYRFHGVATSAALLVGRGSFGPSLHLSVAGSYTYVVSSLVASALVSPPATQILPRYAATAALSSATGRSASRFHRPADPA